MSKKWGYALATVGGMALGGILGAASWGYMSFQRGYEKGYNESEPEITVLNYKTHGIEGMCVVKNDQEMICAADVDGNGSVDLALLDLQTQQVKEVLLGEDDCVSKYMRKLEEEIQKQQPEPQQLRKQ